MSSDDRLSFKRNDHHLKVMNAKIYSKRPFTSREPHMKSHHHCHEVRHIMVHRDNGRTSLERTDESARRPSMWPGFFPGLDFIRRRSLLVLYPDLAEYFFKCTGFPLSLKNPNLI